jgi:cell division protein FtsL
MKIASALVALFFVTPALAQQQQQMSPAAMALAINQAVGQLAQQIEAEKTRAEQLQQQVTTLQKQLSDLQAKTAEKK